jgi:farnesol dehydrogenase
MIKIPLKIIMIISRIQLHLAELTGNPPIITPVWVKKYYHSWAISSNKAKNELGYQITPFYEGMLKTIEWLKK